MSASGARDRVWHPGRRLSGSSAASPPAHSRFAPDLAVLRRTSPGEDGPALSYADLVIDEQAHEVRRDGQPPDLSPAEFTLLRYLTHNAGRAWSKAQILDHVWRYDFGGNANVVETYISYLRKKVDRSVTPLIHTVRGGPATHCDGAADPRRRAAAGRGHRLRARPRRVAARARVRRLLPRRRRAHGGGSRLGLSIVAAVAAAHGGAAGVRANDAPRATFWVELPAG